MIAVGDRPWSGGHLLGVTSSVQSAATMTPMDCYVRGDDLIAVYETGQPDAARVDLLWHAARPATGAPWHARVDLLVSVRSDRLDWRHAVCLESALPELSVVEDGDSLGDLFAARGWWLALMVHPSDLGHRALTAETETSTACRLHHQLFQTDSLEKGVILRARARVWFLPSGVERAVVDACFAEFAAADPPLGT